ncbi:hypothetical protein C8Q80DRAFT_599396 [Daedaleopsis nitida]|nr:hypothetical protein C8Q80DRAFT_599396 [Daedaleopsis nitida]
MDDIESALNRLNACIAKTKDNKRLEDAAAHVSTHLVLLKLSTISAQVSERLSNFLRESLAVLYAAVPDPTLRLAAAIFESVYHNRLLPAIGSPRGDQQALWESLLYALLSGILDYLEINESKKAKDAVGNALFVVLSDVCFSLSAPRTGTDLRCTAYNLLVDAAASHQVNQNKLRDEQILGGARLGSCIWRTRDYLALEGLLNLFARVLPSTNKSSSGRAQRTTFIHSVFESTAPPELAHTGRQITEILEHVPTSDWEETSYRIVDALARGNVAYPQPFVIDEVVIAGQACPSDRIYADDKSFLINVLLEEGQYESLEIPYPTVTKLSFDQNCPTLTKVSLTLSSIPRLGKEPMQINDASTGSHSPVEASFFLQTEYLDRFSQALDSRTLKHAVGQLRSTSVPKLSLAIEPARLELDSAGNFVEPSQSERIENVSQFYRTDDPSDDIQSGSDFEEFDKAIEVTSQPIRPFITRQQPVEAEAALQIHPDSTQPAEASERGSQTSLTRTRSQVICDVAFGSADDDLSDISDISECDSPAPKSKILRRASTSTSVASMVRGRLSFEPASKKASTARLARGRVGNIVLDSDEDSPPALPMDHPRPIMRILGREPTTEAVAEEPALSLPFVPFVSAATALPASAVPTTPPSQPDINAHIASTVCLQPGTDKILRFSNAEIPAPDFNAALSSPSVVPKSALRSALIKNRMDSSPPHAPSPARKSKTRRLATVKANDALRDLALLPSSPTPGPKRSVKDALRKKDDALAVKPLIDSNSNNPAKRKALADEDENDENVPPVSAADDARPAKRARTSRAADHFSSVAQAPDEPKSKPTEQPSSVLRPATAMRARKKYHARKGRTSSPAPALTDGLDLESGPRQKEKEKPVDYDALPSPPRAATAAAVPSSLAKKKAPQEKVTKTRKTTAKSEKVSKTEQASKREEIAQSNTAKVEKAGKATKREKVSKPETTDEVPTACESAKLLTNAEKADATTTEVAKAEKTDKANKTRKTAMKKAHKPEQGIEAVAGPTADPVDEGPSRGKGTSSSPAARRVLPRPRKSGAAKDKDKDKPGENAKQAEQAEIPTAAAPVRTSARAAAAAAKRRIDAQKERETAEETDRPEFDGKDVEAAVRDTAFGEDAVSSNVVDYAVPLLMESPLRPTDITASTKPEEMPALQVKVLSSARKTAATLKTSAPSTAKKSSKTPWDTLAELSDNQPGGAESVSSATDAVDTTLVHDDFADLSAQNIVEDITLVQHSSDSAPDKVLITTSPQKEARAHEASSIPLAQLRKKLRASVHEDPRMISPEVVKPSSIAIKKEPETIDLTVDSPPRPAKRHADHKPRKQLPLLTRVQVPPIVPSETVKLSSTFKSQSALPPEKERQLDVPVRRGPQHTTNSAREAARAVVNDEKDAECVAQSPTPHLQLPSQGVVFANKRLARRKREMALAAENHAHAQAEELESVAGASAYSGDPHMQRIVEVLDQIHQVVVQSIANKFEGVRHEAREGRRELLQRAAEDLRDMHAQSIDHFNGLVALEFEYAAAGRALINGTEDWTKVNRDVCRELATAIEVHDRSMLSKKMPAALVQVPKL